MEKNFYCCQGTREGRQLPTFYLDGDQLGISEKHATELAKEVIGAFACVSAIKTPLDTVNPTVGMILHIETQRVMAVVEWRSGVNSKELLRCWAAMQGLDPEQAEHKYAVNGCAITKWAEIKDAFTPLTPSK